MKSTDETTTPSSSDPAARGEIDGLLKRWPEVAAPSGGYDGLAERVGKAVEEGRAVDEGLDVFARPVLPGVIGEPTGGGDVDGPKLETLAALARESALPPKRESRVPEKAEAKDPRSGVINLKAMIEQAATQEAEASKLSAALAKDGAPSIGAGAAGATATPAPLATTQPSTPVAFAAKPAEKKSGSSMLAIAAIVLIAGAGAYVMLNKQAAPTAEPDEPAVADQAAEEVVATRAQNEEQSDRTVAEAAPAAPSPAPVATPTEDTSATTTAEPGREPGATPARAARGGGGTAARPQATGGTAAEGPAQAPDAPAAAPAPAPAAAAPPAEPEAPPAPTKRNTQDLDALISGSLGPGGAADPAAPAAAAQRAAAPEGALPQPNRQQIQRGMGRVAGAVRACANGQTGMVMLRITFTSDGAVSSASVASGPFAGTPAAGCMENAARAARVPAFTNPNVTVSYPIMVQPPDPAAAAAPPAP